MRTHDIVLLDGSHFVSDMLERVIAKTSGLRIVAKANDPEKYEKVIRQSNVDWIILVLQPGEEVPDSVNEIFLHDMSMQMMVVEADGNHVRMKWYEPHEVELGERNLGEILQILVENNPTQLVGEKILEEA
jgi:chemotaxis response regulator CheB